MRYWLLVTSKDVWDLMKVPDGHVEPFELYDDHGKRRRHYFAFDEIREGDLLWGYVGGDGGGVVARMSCVASKHEDACVGELQIDVRKDETVSRLPFAVLKLDPIVSRSTPVRCGCRGTLFELTSEEFSRIEELIRVVG